MNITTNPVGLRDLGRAIEDIRLFTLAPMPSELAKLVSIASIRDYNNGAYYYAGISDKYTFKIAQRAFEVLHNEVFEGLVFAPLETLVQDLDTYVKSAAGEPSMVVKTWINIQPYKFLIPQNCDPVASEFLFSKVKIALAMLEMRQRKTRDLEQSSSPPP